MAKFEITVEPRTVQGKGASRRLRRTGKVPGIIYGAGKAPEMIALNFNQIARNLEDEKFHSSILTVQQGGQSTQAILRDWHVHPVKSEVMHVDLQRISATEKIHMKVPLHFLGQAEAPGVKLEGGIVTHMMTEADVTCLPKDLPEFLEIDMSQMHLHQSVHLSDIKLPEGVQFTSLIRGDDLAVAAVVAIKVEEEAPVAVAAVAAPAEGAAAAPAAGAAAPAAGEKKGEAAPKAEAKKPEGGKK